MEEYDEFCLNIKKNEWELMKSKVERVKKITEDSLYPTIEDIDLYSKEKNLYRNKIPHNIIDGPWVDSTSYVRTQKILLKEDCFEPLLQGISDLRRNCLDARDMKIYKNVKIAGCIFEPSEGLILHFFFV